MVLVLVLVTGDGFRCVGGVCGWGLTLHVYFYVGVRLGAVGWVLTLGSCWGHSI